MALSTWSTWLGLRWAVNTRVLGLQFSRTYARNPLERRSMEQLLKGVSGGLGGRGGRGRKKGGKKALKQSPAITLGIGRGGERWPGLSVPLNKTKYDIEWLQSNKLGIQKTTTAADVDSDFKVFQRDLEGARSMRRRVSEMNWSYRGWSGKRWNGRYVGCPEAPDGTPLTDFRSVVIELKRVSNQTAGGKKRTVSALVVVGNGNGAAGFAVGRGEETKVAIRKAKNKAVNYLQFIPRYEGHTISAPDPNQPQHGSLPVSRMILEAVHNLQFPRMYTILVYHNIDVKYCRTKVLMERKVIGSGLHCQRAISAICELSGLKNMRAKIIGSTNPLNIVRAIFKGLTSQETHQSLADKTGQFLVEYRRECGYRPVVIAVPKSMDSSSTIKKLQSLHLMPKQVSTTSSSSTSV